MPFEGIYHPEVKEDIAKLDKTQRERIKKAIETKLMTFPQKYGKPLRGTLKGYWKLRVGNYRIVFKFKDENTILIFAVMHRTEVYPEARNRNRN